MLVRRSALFLLRPLFLSFALALVIPTLAAAQDFGIMESAETISKGAFKVKVNPIFVLQDVNLDASDTGIAVAGGYGLTKTVDVEAKFAHYDSLNVFGADVEWWALRRDANRKVDFSVSAGFHSGRFAEPTPDYVGMDFTGILGHHATDKLDIYGALDLAFSRTREDGPDEWTNTVFLVPGIEYKLSPDLDLLTEIGIALNNGSRNYLSFGLAYYFR
jgi:hypothetical protein